MFRILGEKRRKCWKCWIIREKRRKCWKMCEKKIWKNRIWVLFELFWAVFVEEGGAQATINILGSCSAFSCFCALFSFIIGVCSLHLYPLAIMIMSIMLALCFCVFQLYTLCVFHCLHSLYFKQSFKTKLLVKVKNDVESTIMKLINKWLWRWQC